jgi:tetratricopeptide (TPR) repeat protein
MVTMAARKSRKRSKAKRPSRKKTARHAAPESRGLSIASGDISEQLERAVELLRKSREEEIPALLEPLSHEVPSASADQQSLYRRLLAFGYANAGRLHKAEDLCLGELKASGDSMDAHFLLTYIYLAMREYGKAIEHGERYKELTQANTPAAISVGENHYAQVLNFIGSAYFEQRDYEAASEWFEKSIQKDPAYHLPYLNLANAAMRNNRKAEAREIVERGLKKCRQVQDLKLLKESIGKSATISACLMVKNEEEMLPGCLDSVRDWVDEIIVVDTGSTDRTVEIAESYGARVYYQPWEGDFSKHRNYTMELATCDWIFIIDADERFERKDVPGLLEAINSGEHQVISINVYNLYASTQHRLTAINSMRFFRRDLNLRYEGIVHNRLHVPRGIPVTRAPFAIEHLGYDLTEEKMQAKFDRSHELLLKQVEEDPDFAFAWFNLAQLYRGRLSDDLEYFGPKVIECAEKVIELLDPTDMQRGAPFAIMAHDQIGWVKLQMGEVDEAERWALKALEYKSDYLDPLMLLAHVHSRRGEYEQAIEAYQRYLDAQAEYDPNLEVAAMILYHPESLSTANFGMGCMAERLERYEEAKGYYRKALEHTPHYLDAELHLGRLHLCEGDLVAAESAFRAALDGPRKSPRAALGMATVCQHRGDTEEASRWYERAVELGPDIHDVLARAGKFFSEMGQLDRGRKLLEEAAGKDNAAPDTIRNLASVYFASGEFDRAIESYEKLLAIVQDDMRAHNDLGNCYFRREEYEKAEQHYLASLKSEEALPVVWRNLGLCRAHLKRPADALEALEEYLRLGAEDDQVLPLMADLYVALSEHQTAVAYYERFLAKNPYSTAALFGLSECYLHMGHADSAILGYRRVLTLDPAHQPAQKRLAELSGSVAKA